MSSLLETIIPKSDQLNADDLIGCSRTITITDVDVKMGGEQPVEIHYEGDNGRPYKPCKSMRRVLVQVWGADGKQYVGRSLTLYCDPSVKFGGQAVGGIRISHMSHMDAPRTLALTTTRGKKAAFVVKPLEAKALPASAKPASARAEAMVAEFAKFGVTLAMIERAIGHSIAAITDADLLKLGQTYKEIKGGADKEEFFPTEPQSDQASADSDRLDMQAQDFVDAIKDATTPAAIAKIEAEIKPMAAELGEKRMDLLNGLIREAKAKKGGK